MNNSDDPPAVFVAIVVHNHREHVAECLKALRASCAVRLHLHVLDNASEDGSPEVLSSLCRPDELHLQNVNLGFSGGMNELAKHFLASPCEMFALLNPDVVVEPDCLASLARVFQRHIQAGLATPRLLRMAPEAGLLDAAGMKLTFSLRHFDRGAGEDAPGRFEQEEEVFGGTGACLMLRRACLVDCILKEKQASNAQALFSVFPQLESEYHERPQVFDEGFFAYREDAELALRAQRFGWQCWYTPKAIAHHARAVRTERRATNSAFVNALGVQNRFLLQWTHFPWFLHWRAFFSGHCIRNLLVILGVLCFERSSLNGIRNAWKLRKRALHRRACINQRARTPLSRLVYWMEKGGG